MTAPKRASHALLGRKDVAAALALLLAVDLWAIRFIGQERWLYHADEVAYWSPSVGLAHTLAVDPWSAFVNLSTSVAHNTINLIPAFPIGVALLALGDSRLAYVLAVVNVYGLAVILTFFVAARRLGGDPRLGAAWSRGAIVASLLLATPLWQPVLLGYLDVGGVAIALAILALYLSRVPEDLPALQLVTIGFLTAFLFLFRRWYGFWSVAFCSLVALDWVGAVARRRSGALRPPLMIGVAAAGTLVLLAFPMVMQVAATDFADKFAAFKTHHGVAAELLLFLERFGVVLLVVAALGAGLLLAGSRAGRRLALFLLAQMVIIFLLMRRIQDPDIHHFYLYLPGIMCLVVVASQRALARLASTARRSGLLFVLFALGGVVAAGVVSPTAAHALRHLVPGRVTPKVRNDLPEVDRLLAYLDERLRERPGYIYVFSSGGVITDQTLAFANLSTGAHHLSPRFVLQSSHLDRRDGFPCMLPRADYVVLPWPIQPASRPSEVRVVLIPAQSIAGHRNIGKAFRRLPGEFHLDHAQTVYVYEKVRRLLPSEMAALSELLQSAYPDRPDIYGPCSYE